MIDQRLNSYLTLAYAISSCKEAAKCHSKYSEAGYLYNVHKTAGF